MLSESFAANVMRSAETWQFFAFVFAALLTISFGLIDELKSPLHRTIGKIAATLLIGYFTLFSTWGRNVLAGLLPGFTHETIALSGQIQSSFSWEVVAALASAIIALCALFLTIWQARQTQRHNKLSVTPFLTTWSTQEFTSHHYRVLLLNNGIGPALIRSFAIEVDGHLVGGPPSDQVERALQLLFPNHNYTSEHGYVGPRYMMASKEERVLADITFTAPPFPPRAAIGAIDRRVRILIRYDSIYGDEVKLDSHDIQAH